MKEPNMKAIAGIGVAILVLNAAAYLAVIAGILFLVKVIFF